MTDPDSDLAVIITGLRAATHMAEQAFHDLHLRFEQIGALVATGGGSTDTALVEVCAAMTIDMQFIDRFAQYQHSVIAALEALRAGNQAHAAPCAALLSFDRAGHGVELF